MGRQDAWTGALHEGPALLAPLLAVAQPVRGTTGPLPFAALGAIHLDPVEPVPAVEVSTLLGELRGRRRHPAAVLRPGVRRPREVVLTHDPEDVLVAGRALRAVTG